jgi:6-phosphogluconolactonase (cycloisomerase 2 family)
MKPVLTLTALGCAGLLATVLLAAPAIAAPGPPTDAAHPVFVQTDNPAGNTIVAYDRTSNGSLAPAGSYATGGLGGVVVPGNPDNLASQGSLAYKAGMLFAVNAGSNTITTFAVHGDQLERRQVLPSAGTFPASITAHGNLVYVLNARDGGSIQGYLRLGSNLVEIPWWHRNLGLDTSRTPDGTLGQIAFTPDGHRLIVTTKNGGNDVEVFRLQLGWPSTPMVTSLPGIVPFSLTFDQAGHLDLAERGTNGVATFTVNPDDSLTQLDSFATGQVATCWIVAVDGKLYLSNAASGTLSGVAVAQDGTLTGLGNTPTDAGPTDAAASPDGRYLYVQTGAAGNVDEFRINPDGSLASLGSVTIPNAVGAEGIVAL